MKHQFTLDEPAIDFSDVAFLSILSSTPDYALVDDLNHLYDLALHRIDDAVVGEHALPLYVHGDAMRHLDYYLVALAPVAEGYLLIVRGSSCREVLSAIEGDFSAAVAEPHPADLPAVRRHAILSRYQSAFTPVSVVEFTPAEIDEASRPGRHTLKGRVLLADIFARILDHLDLAGL